MALLNCSCHYLSTTRGGGERGGHVHTAILCVVSPIIEPLAEAKQWQWEAVLRIVAVTSSSAYGAWQQVTSVTGARLPT